jgi:3-hydroxybutyrate dehydrogenase
MTARIAIVTGGASGIGLAIAETLARQGDQVLVADLNDDRGPAAAASIGGQFVAADLAQPDDCRRLVDEALGRYGRIDILINNAGFQHIDPIEVFPEDTWNKMLAVMVTAPFLLTKYAWPAMKAQAA